MSEEKEKQAKQAEADRFFNAVKGIESSTSSNITVASVVDGCTPTGIQHVVIKDGRPVCWTRSMDDAMFVMDSIKGANKFVAFMIGAMLCGRSVKKEEVPHGV